MSDENILVVPTHRVDNLGIRDGYTSITDIKGFLQFAEFKPRSQMEKDENFQQLIPYIVLMSHIGCVHVETPKEMVIWGYTRSKSGGEDRLHDKKSVGIGGHVRYEDAAIRGIEEVLGETVVDDYYNLNGETVYSSALFRGMLRELDEEIDIYSPLQQLSMSGLIRETASAVGRVHLGVVFSVFLKKPLATAKELDLAMGGFMPPRVILNNIDKYETWSQIVIKKFT